ncbi:hypothetical protein PGT21_013764 [Puccinia graminis f. sp. tritici]|uniref:Uncharacterized protein n=1 Tax=Puccinia graminis f. sp. tritici TaxID=56615 RepID=A0A5B0MES4_PUCGR|nr:hypothetical protein PGT21_013764 [Puccinia graminis f. sp. tritici]
MNLLQPCDYTGNILSWSFAKLMACYQVSSASDGLLNFPLDSYTVLIPNIQSQQSETVPFNIYGLQLGSQETQQRFMLICEGSMPTKK